MKARPVYTLSMFTALAAACAGLGLGRAIAAEPVPAATGPVEEVLTRGPVHEAFAEAVTFDPQPGVVVPKGPPNLIEEIPPDQRPAGNQITWIPGYWGWDDERGDFLWVSGVWRALPPGQQWVPGRWSPSGQGFQWISGYWSDATAGEIEYLPEPPLTVEAGANIAAPSPDYYWVPGCWVWHGGRYAWRPGCWIPGRRDWDWVPAHYIWTPRGYVFSDGYWDYPINARGVLFAPVHFEAGLYARAGFRYSPSVVIDPAVFEDHLFVRGRYGHYYFGDYYAAGYQEKGFVASFAFNSGHRGYDPIYAHRLWEHRQDHEWEHHVQADFQNRRDHEDARPPRTLAAQIKLSVSGLRPTDRNRVLATPFTQLAGRKDSPMKFQPVAREERQQIAQRASEVQAFRATRQKLEAITAPPPTGKPARVAIPRSPIVARSAAQLGKDHAPPKRPGVPKPDPRVTPKRTPIADGNDKGRDKDK